jgi:hypothetical protein
VASAVRAEIEALSWDAEIMNLDEACKPRSIGKINVQTPLVVPSFSSAVLEQPFQPDMYAKLSELMTDASLFSAYDLHLRKIAQEDIWISDVVFVDSGNYELEHIKEVAEQFRESMDARPKKWTFQMYARIIDSLKPPPFRKAVLVNYDEKKSLDEQVDDARDFFARHERFASCFLCKPPDKSLHRLNIESLVDNVESIDQFDILGVTEKELGNSLLSRCTNILRIRNALQSRGSDRPIHVFGCLDPLGIVCYFLCGADIFDGTLWLKYGFHENVAFYINNYALLKGTWHNTDGGVAVMSWMWNLRDLTALMLRMRRYAQKHEDNLLEFGTDIKKEIKDLAKTAAMNAG